MLRLFDAGPLIFYVAAFGGAFLIGTIARAVKGDGARSLLTGLEAGVLAPAGAFLAGSVVSLSLSAAGDAPAAAIVVGFGAFLWVGLIDLISYLAAGQVLVTPVHLVWIALAVGGCAGLFAGLHRIYDWAGVGWVAFPLDVTWGLAGTTHACLLHLIDTAMTRHAPETRRNAHRYLGGFRIKRGFAFTQGAVMSNLGVGPPTAGSYGRSLYRHERTHVWQNRVFGPAFTLTFLSWMALMVAPGTLAGAASKRASVGTGIEWWTYYDNPWEVWAYRYGGRRSHPSAWMCWPLPAVIATAVVFYPLAVVLLAWPVRAVWFP